MGIRNLWQRAVQGARDLGASLNDLAVQHEIRKHQNDIVLAKQGLKLVPMPLDGRVMGQTAVGIDEQERERIIETARREIIELGGTVEAETVQSMELSHP